MVPLFIVDAFTDRPFRGNPAGVVVLDAPAEASWMQAVAGEVNLPETAFLVPAGDHWALRWFTPTAEVDLCGHATLASAHALWEDARADPEHPLVFATASGPLTATRAGDRITLDFPAEPAVAAPAPGALCDALGVTPVASARNRLDWLVEVAGEEEVAAAAPDIARLAALTARGVILTAPSDRDGVDFVSRFFAPAIGVPEDPVTGSAHCALGPWWAARLGREALIGFQCSRRGGTVAVTVRGKRVELGGSAVTVVRGSLVDAGPMPSSAYGRPRPDGDGVGVGDVSPPGRSRS